MAFWGVEVKPGTPFSLLVDDKRGRRLHLSLATLGHAVRKAANDNKSTLQCNVGNKSPIFLCSLFPVTSECCQLNLEFEEIHGVVFSVIGNRSIHLSGYFLSNHHESDGSESYGEDIQDTESEKSAGDSDDYDYDDAFINDEPELHSSSFASSDNPVIERSSQRRKSKSRKPIYKRKMYKTVDSDGDSSAHKEMSVDPVAAEVAPEGASEDLLPISSLMKDVAIATVKEKVESCEVEDKADERSKMKVIMESGSEELMPISSLLKDDVVATIKEKVESCEVEEKANERSKTKGVMESGSEELMPISSLLKDDVASIEKLVNENVESNEVEDKVDEGSHNTTNLGVHDDSSLAKKCIRSLDFDVLEEKDDDNIEGEKNDLDKINCDLNGASMLEVDTNKIVALPGVDDLKIENTEIGDDIIAETDDETLHAYDKVKKVDPPSNNEVGEKTTIKCKVKKKRKQEEVKEESENQSISDDRLEENKKKKKKLEEGEEKDDKDNKSSGDIRTLPNGLTIEVLKAVKQDKKTVTLGKKVSIRYLAMLKDNGQVFYSNLEDDVLKFRIGQKVVIDGLNIGLEGMRVGEKRRLGIPPTLGFGSEGNIAKGVPPNAWLIYEVKLVKRWK